MSRADSQSTGYKVVVSKTLVSDGKILIDISLASVADKALNALGRNRVPFTGPMNVLIKVWLITGHEAGVQWLEQCHALEFSRSAKIQDTVVGIGLIAGNLFGVRNQRNHEVNISLRCRIGNPLEKMKEDREF
jgi:hypothetical protein